ncbi:MAG TPA: 50S ribosomal protein L22 [Thermoanaerobaculia bacterium]|nr:50S ribosomal protein L22 [Thermoanaerobaculia bacterium]
MEARAQLRYMKASPQKVRLVVDLVRGKKVEEALEILRFTKKACARHLEKLVRSAVANAENSEASADVDELVVARIWVDDGPREKRIQPAPMGRAYQIIKRQSHVTVELSDEVAPAGRKGRTAETRKPGAARARKAPAKGRPRRK